ncbi:GDSL esterase/lipase-like [Iris pallida]|uniref:GDSL esterase/lipase-like n=1 Tax=Iris pallida TaxID=29817 RepID=A0AAX6GV98_IRIPA|nr:GDSL esterase/lipase-like [Iris pallida]
MLSFSSSSTAPPLTILLLLLLSSLRPATSCYRSIISFGDSVTDTGNLIRYPGREDDHATRLPFGRTHFGRPTGRFSDGRLVVDFLAEAFGLPPVPPFLGGAGDGGDGFRRGVNFAVGGATAIDNDFFREKGFHVRWPNYSLNVQLESFKKLLPSLCSSASECKDFLSKSLVLVGEIGGNDYNHGFLQRRNFAEIEALVPKVIDVIASAVTELISLGARTLVVPGNFPIGCVPVYLAMYKSNQEEDYELDTGCIKWMNVFAEYHNHKLLEELDRLRKHNPSTTIIYVDYYNAAMNIFRSPDSYGFGREPFAACCGGGGGPHNFDPSILCGSDKAKVCDNPSEYISWDGLHLTEAAYKTIADMVIHGPFADPAINSTCASINMEVNNHHEEL